MRNIFVISLLFVPNLTFAPPCCLGGGPKSFIQLRDLQNYQLGVSSSLRDTYGRYDAYGDLVRAEKDQTFTMAFGAGAKFIENLDSFVILPIVYRIKQSALIDVDRGNLGDVLVGSRLTVLRSLFHDEWYPTINISAGLKVPTGTVDGLSQDGHIAPGTGNGIWERFVGLGLQKDYGFLILNGSMTYTGRFGRTITGPGQEDPIVVKEGDRIELSESGLFPLTRRLSITVGSAQEWDLPRKLAGQMVSDSEARVTSLFFSSNYFLTQYWSLSAGAEFSVPIARLGMNLEATRTMSLTSTYTFY